MSKHLIQWDSDEDFIQRYYELKSSRKMGEYYKCDKGSVLNHAKKIGFNVKSVQTPKLTPENKKYIISMYNTKTSTELAEEFNVSRGMITKVWYDANLSGKETIITKTTEKEMLNKVFSKAIVLTKTSKRSANGSIIWHCKCSCGKEFDADGSQLRNGKIISCGHISKTNWKNVAGWNFQNLENQIFGKLKVIKRAENASYGGVQWECLCGCGRITTVLASNLKNGNTQSCGFCNEKSHGNIKINKILSENNIPFTREKRFFSCKDKTYLPFDFYVNNNYLIEFDGIQHFEENPLFDYNMTKRHDEIKNKWCKDNNISLIRIPYTHLKDLCLEDLLLETSSYIIN